MTDVRYFQVCFFIVIRIKTDLEVRLDRKSSRSFKKKTLFFFTSYCVVYHVYFLLFGNVRTEENVNMFYWLFFSLFTVLNTLFFVEIGVFRLF